MATGKINSTASLSGIVSTTSQKQGVIVGGSGGSSDHNKLANRDLDNQHPISAITGLEAELESKLDSSTALPLINEALNTRACGLFYDAMRQVSYKPFWYLTSEIDPVTKLGIPGDNNEYIISGPYNLSSGGGGGGGGITTVTLSNIDPETGSTMWPTTIAFGTSCEIGINWSSKRDGEPTGNGTIFVYINGKSVISKVCAQGVVRFDITEFLVSGDNAIEVKVLDAYSTTKNLIGSISALDLYIESTFNKYAPRNKSFIVNCIPYGAVSKTIMCFIDDATEPVAKVEDVTTTGEAIKLEIPKQAHGGHLLKIYFTCKIGDETIKSNELIYDVICYEDGNKTPIIVSDFNELNQEQFIAFNIKYRVFIYGDSSGEHTTVDLLIDDEVFAHYAKLDRAEQNWEYKSDVDGTKTLSIKCQDVQKDFIITFKKSEIDVKPVSQGLSLALTAYGKSNKDTDKDQWIDSAGNRVCTLTGFNYKSDGWLKDDSGNSVLRVGGDARVTIPYKMFSPDYEESMKEDGRTIEIEFATNNVLDYDTRILDCTAGQQSATYDTYLTGDDDDRKNKFTVTDFNSNMFMLLDSVVTLGFGSYTFIYNGIMGEGGKWNLMFTGEDADEPILVAENINFEDYYLYVELVKNSSDTTYKCYENGDRIVVSYLVMDRGLYITPQYAVLQTKQKKLSTLYKENEQIRLTFVIEPAGKTSLFCMYINGIMSSASKLSSSDSFVQLATDAANISIGSNLATIDIYNIRVYNIALSRKQVVSNWIADTQDGALKANRYVRNNIYNSDGKVVISQLPTNLPYIIFSKLTDNKLPANKADKRTGRVDFVYPTDTSRNFYSEGVRYNAQGTSSEDYYKKNLKIKFQNDIYIGPEDNLTKAAKYPLTPGATAEKTFTLKADVASSEGTNNVELARFYEDSRQWTTPVDTFKVVDGSRVLSKKTRTGIDGFPMVAFFNNGTDTNFYGKMNFNNDKGTASVYGFKCSSNKTTGEVDFTKTDESWEMTQNSDRLNLFKSDNLTNWQGAFESRFPEKIDDNTLEAGEHDYGTKAGELDKLQAMMSWVVSTDRTKATNAVLVNPVVYEGITYTNDTASYRLAKFRSELKQYFNVDSSLFYYLYTDLFLLVDSRAKNSMPTYYYSREDNDGGNRWFWIPYDMDTALGIDNEGRLKYDYSVEDDDLVDGRHAFNAYESVFWNNIRDAFPNELSDLYNRMRSGDGVNASWTYDNIETRYEEHQDYWSEAIFNEDAYVKYIEPYVDPQGIESTSAYLAMLQGSKEIQRKWWLTNRFKYIDSKYRVQDASTSRIQLRATCNGIKELDADGNPVMHQKIDKSGQPVYDEYGNPVMVNSYIKEGKFEITPYMDCYTTVVFDQNINYSTARAKKDQTVTLYPYDETWDPSEGTDPRVAIFSAELLKDVGDLTCFKPSFALFEAATKLQRIILGDKDGAKKYPNQPKYYINDALDQLSIGANKLLNYIDISNCTKLTGELDISECPNVEYGYFGNTGLAQVKLPNGGVLKELVLPKTITDLTLVGFPALQKLTLEGTANLTSVDIQDIPYNENTIDPYQLVTGLTDGAKIRLYGIDMTFTKARGLEPGEVTIEKFLDKLNKLAGIDSEDKKAQVQGIIRIDYMEWTDYNYLTTHYPFTSAITMIVGQIRCTVNFWNDDILLDTQYVMSGNAATAPETPSRAPTHIYYYTFDKWSKPFDVVTTDLEVRAEYIAHLQPYTATFNSQSPLVTVNPAEQTVEYGNKITKPELAGVPEGVVFMGWYDSNLEYSERTIWDFDPVTKLSTKVLEDNTTLYAKWNDTAAPNVEVFRVAHNKFRYICSDNFGIVAWQVTKTSDLPTTWINIAPTTFIDDIYTVSTPGHYHLWVRDSNNQVAVDDIQVYPISVDYGTGVKHVVLTENEAPVSAFATAGTELKVFVDLKESETTAEFDVHYTNARFSVDGIEYTNNSIITINNSTEIAACCDPKTYTVSFELNGLGTPVENQYITYLHKAVEPDPQLDKSGLIIANWYKDNEFTTVWNFETDIVENNTIIYAKWEKFSDPTLLYVDTAAGQKITLSFTQDSAQNVKIWWDYDPDKIPSRQSTLPEHSDNKIDPTVTSIEHTYDTAGVHIIGLVAGENGTYYIGGGTQYNPVLKPITVVTKVKFAVDTPFANSYAFNGAINLLEAELTRYMTKISIGTFKDCVNLNAIEIPSNIVTIESEAFKNCSSLPEIINFNTKLQTIGAEAFSGCISVKNFDLKSMVNSIGRAAFMGCTALETITIPESLTILSDSLFEGCKSLTEMIIPATVTAVGSSDGGRIFIGCSSLEKVHILTTTDEFGQNNFSNCPKLTSIGPINAEGYSIEYSWTDHIPKYAFLISGSNIINIKLLSTIKYIGEQAFQGNSSVSTLELPEALEYIDKDAFYGLGMLQSIVMPVGLTTIGQGAFYNCTQLLSITLNENLQNIGEQAFYRCRKLTTITIPASVQAIGYNCFDSCTGLKNIQLKTAVSTVQVKDWTQSWFINCTSTLQLHIPRSLNTAEAAIEAYGIYWNYANATTALAFASDIE